MFIRPDSVSRSTFLFSIGIKGTSRSKQRLARNCSTSMPLVYLKRIPTSRQQSLTSDHSSARLQRPKRRCPFFSIWLILPGRHRIKAQRTCSGISRPKPTLIRRACKLSSLNSSWSTRELLWNLLRADTYRPAVGKETGVIMNKRRLLGILLVLLGSGVGLFFLIRSHRISAAEQAPTQGAESDDGKPVAQV